MLFNAIVLFQHDHDRGQHDKEENRVTGVGDGAGDQGLARVYRQTPDGMDHYIGQINVANHQSVQEWRLLYYCCWRNTHDLSQRPWEEVMNMRIERIDATDFFLHPIDDLPAPVENLPEDEDPVDPPAVEDEDPMNLPVVVDPMDLQVVEDQLVDNQAHYPVEDESDESTITNE
ncbi:hypothetical protein ACE6H2_023101 [Prunus campanulata]